MQLVKNSGIKYSIVIRARPDHTFVRVNDLRAYAREFAERPSVKRARGHFFAIPERHQGQVIL